MIMSVVRSLYREHLCPKSYEVSRTGTCTPNTRPTVLHTRLLNFLIAILGVAFSHRTFESFYDQVGQFDSHGTGWSERVFVRRQKS
jgi:hypothetical protein